jgi:predicted MFS family arabinose efflux permease
VFALATLTLLLAATLFALRVPETLVRRPGAGHDEAIAIDPGNLPATGAGEALAAVPVAVPARVGSGALRPAPTEWYRNRSLLLYVTLHLLTFGTYIQLFGIFPVDGRDRLGLAPGTWALILAVNGAMILFGQGLVSLAVRRLHRPFAVAVGVLIWAIGFAILGLTTTASLVLPAVVVLTLGEMTVFPIQPAVVAELAPVEGRARYQGALTMGGSIGNAIGPGIAGFAVAALGGGWWIVVAVAMLGLAGAYALFGVRVMPRAEPAV